MGDGSKQFTFGDEPIADHEIEKKREREENERNAPLCECGEEKEYVNEPESGFVGWVCVNENCSFEV